MITNTFGKQWSMCLMSHFTTFINRYHQGWFEMWTVNRMEAGSGKSLMVYLMTAYILSLLSSTKSMKLIATKGPNRGS